MHHRRLRAAARPHLHHIDVEQAHRVASAFLDAPREQANATVRAAYADLARQADRWFARLTTRAGRAPIRVGHTGRPEPYATGEELSARVRTERVLELCPAALESDRAHPMLDMTPGGTYDRFRAVHDLVSHAGLGLGFDRDGEYTAWLIEDGIYRGLARWALATELHAEHSVRWTTGTVAEHKAVLLPPALLRASRRPPLLPRDPTGAGPDEAHLHRIGNGVVATMVAAA